MVSVEHLSSGLKMSFWIKKVTLSVFYGKYWKVVCSFGIAFSFLFDIHLIYESIVGHSII